MTELRTPHKHAELIKAWADGAEIEVFSTSSSKWYTTRDPHWDSEKTYRIKPEPPKPHKWQHCIDAQAAGKVVQRRRTSIGYWVDGPWKFNDPECEYRIKPETVRQRVALMKGGDYYTLAVNNPSHERITADGTCFVRWLGDWQEIEVE